MNELIEQIKRDAVTIQKFTEAELQTRQILKTALGPAYKEVEATHDAIDRIMTRNAQTEARMFNDTAKRLDAASTRIHELEGKLQTAETRIAELLCEPDQAVRTLRDLESTANDNGRKPDEAVREFLTRTVSELMTADAKVRRIQKHAIICNAKPDESVIDFMSRMKDANAQLKQQLAEADSAAHSASNDGLSNLQIENLKRQLQTAKDDLERQHLRETKISAEYQADIKKILTTANKLGRADYESPESFMNRQAADMESQKRELYLVRQESDNKTQNVIELSRWHEENLKKIKVLEADLAQSRSQESPEATRNALRNVTEDRDRIRTELASILAEANKSGRCNGDPVRLLKQGQADLDALTSLEKEKANLLARLANLEAELKAANAAALSAEEDAERATFSENESAKLNALVSQLQGELAEARAAQQKAETAETVSHKRFMDLMKQSDSCGRLAGESLESFIARLTNERGKAWNREIQASEKVARLERQSASEIARLSALVASLQVELEDAKRKYGDIMAALGNETPLQLIERMQRLAQDQRASTIPHDERAMLVAESADLRKRLEASQKAHAKTEHELGGKLRAALATVENQSAAIAEAKQATEKYTAVVEAADKLKEWASTIRHKVLVAMVHTRAMAEYDTIMKELDGGKVPQ